MRKQKSNNSDGSLVCSLAALAIISLNLAVSAADTYVFPSSLESPSLDENAFTQVFKEVLVKHTGANVTIVRPLQLHVKHKNGFEGTTYLNNAWASCRTHPGNRHTLLQNYLASEIAISTKKSSEEKTDEQLRSSIVPLLKDPQYIKQIEMVLTAAKQGIVYEPISADLYVVYAIDMPSGMAMLSDDKFKKLGITKEALSKLASENVERIIAGNVQIESKNGIQSLRADGNYESSFILMSKFWDEQQKRLKSPIVMAVPSRSNVLWCGAEDKIALENIRKLAQQIYQTGDHVISDSLYQWKSGRWEKI
jgi:uncharacterized protein YtpQ (UPF0354 family)